MAQSVPTLVPRPTSRALRLLGVAMPGIKSITKQIDPYTAWWDQQNQEAVASSGPLLVAIGDSTAIGIGASTPSLSYVGRLSAQLSERDETSWRMINLALSGARLEDGLERQLPILEDLVASGPTPSLVTCCIGTNDLVWGKDTTRLRDRLRQLVDRLPDGVVMGTLAGGSARARLANRALRNAVAEREAATLVVPWGEPGPEGRERLAEDRFHPNDIGYELMTQPFARALGIEPPRVDDSLTEQAPESPTP